jgi:capsular polysaccharide transport system permease protein
MNRLLYLSARTLKLVLIVVPMLVYTIYLCAIATDRYVSESVVSVRQAGGASGGGIPGAALLLAGINPPAHEDTLHLRTYVHSRALALELDARLKLREHFAAIRADLPFRLSKDASVEDFVDYYRDRVEVSFDDRAALLKVRTQGLDPVFAQRLNQAILASSERFVNETSHRIARERLRFAEGELELAGKRVETASGQLLAFQGRHRLLDPGLQTQASGMLTAELEGQQARLEAQLGSLRGFLNDDAYQIQALKSQIAALGRQIKTEQRRATADDGKGSRLNKLALDFEALKLQAEFARDAYKLALAAVENSRIDANQKIKSLVVLEPPSLPQTAEYPLAAYNLGTLLAVCTLLYAITRLVLSTIREHQD